MEKSKKEQPNAKGKTTGEKETIVTEAIGLLATQAQKTLQQELQKAQESPDPPFFLRKKSLSKNDKTEEDLEKDRVELQNFAFVLAETMAHLLKQAERSLLEKLKKAQTDRKNSGTVNDSKQREDEVRNFSKVFAETRTKLVEKVKELVKELRKGDGGEEENLPNRSENIFSTIGVDFPSKTLTKRPASSTSYDSKRDIAKKPRISATKPKAAKKTKPSHEDVCYICGKGGHWAYQCTKPDDRMCYCCNKTGHISKECPVLDTCRFCSICKKEGHVAADCKGKGKGKRRRRGGRRTRNRRSYSRESSSSRDRERSYSSETSETSSYSR
ncbi:uncharacterized protein LOC135847472 [Planococcus citri]|uniref:uncharacterized protein LOC135847472 n=1 Tax=Planococcus citri TaxID=170843 RepID=UPI0031F75866